MLHSVAKMALALSVALVFLATPDRTGAAIVSAFEGSAGLIAEDLGRSPHGRA